jgi:hypothetical protein
LGIACYRDIGAVDRADLYSRRYTLIVIGKAGAYNCEAGSSDSSAGSRGDTANEWFLESCDVGGGSIGDGTGICICRESAVYFNALVYAGAVVSGSGRRIFE